MSGTSLGASIKAFLDFAIRLEQLVQAIMAFFPKEFGKKEVSDPSCLEFVKSMFDILKVLFDSNCQADQSTAKLFATEFDLLDKNSTIEVES